MVDPVSGNRALVVGASRGLGLRLVQEMLARGWSVIATARGDASALRALPGAEDGRLVVETLDMTDVDGVSALRERIGTLDLVFVNAAIATDDVPIGEVPTDAFVDVMVTNVLSPMRVVEAMRSAVLLGGTIAVMSSRQGSIALNVKGGHDLYRASKSALNQLMRCHAARYADDGHTLLLVHPGHVQTGLGGAGARLTVDDSIPGVMDVLERHAGEPGLQFLDYQDQVVPW